VVPRLGACYITKLSNPVEEKVHFDA